MPDLNSIASNPQGLAVARARRASSAQISRPQQTSQRASSPPPTLSTSPSLNILPSNQPAFQEATSAYLPSPPLPSSSGMAPPPAPGQDNTGVGAGPGPIRHPRPLTAAELHQQLEQEQELLVNRLSRDLTMLRMAQNSSVASNTSSTSASTSAIDQLHPSSFTDTHLLSGPGFPVPTARRHHRTSSTASSRSVSQTATQGSTAPIPIPQSHSGNAASVLEAARNPRGPSAMSRQNSTTSHRSSSRARSPQPYMNTPGLLPSSHSQPHGFPQDYGSGYFGRDRASSNASVAATPGSELSPGLMPATLRYEETAHYRSELESAKRENEMLKKRVKDLEKMLRDRRESDHGPGRVRSESSSTTTSISVSGPTGVGGVVGGGTGIAGGRRDDRRIIDRTTSAMSASSMGVGVPDEELKVGESAATGRTPSGPSTLLGHDTK
ncbi:hypothetical protein F5Y07DRAFT_381448 [Xylaria sp. FL0933]|nr:hypothetical protein F5Y07DRAFT_381448 [Xylaria sp. FL0933]